MIGFLKNLFNEQVGNQSLKLIAPMTGELTSMADVPDTIFASTMVGEGLAVDPSAGLIKAPCDGEIIQFTPGGHAIGIKTGCGVEVLIHIGVDTVKMKGEGFEKLVKKGDQVKQGDDLIKADLQFLEDKVPSLLTSVLVTNMDQVEIIDKKYGSVIAGETVMMELKKL